MTSIARIIHNYEKGSADYVIVTYEGEVLWQGHSLPNSPKIFMEMSQCIGNADMFLESSLTDEQIENWKESVYGE